MRPMPFVDRDHQVDAVLGYAAEAAAGTGRLVLVEGEAGVGKSTLLEQVEARLPDATWHWGACDGLFTPLPLAPLRDIAEDLGGPLLDATRGDASRETLFAALVDAIRAGDRLVVLVVEDVHWADEATLDLLRHTGRRIQKERALLLVTFRDDETTSSAPLRLALGELSRQRATRRVTLPPLSRGAVERLVRGTSFDAAEVHDLTGGNPYFVAEVLGGDGTHLPASARDAVLARVAPLDAGARCLLDAAALGGTRVDPALLASVIDDPTPPYDAVLAAGLFVTDSSGLRFRHEIARLAVADAVPEPRRSHLHRRLLTALTESGVDDDARLAFHAAGAGDTQAVLRHAMAAGRRAAGLAAHREALAHFRLALSASSDPAVGASARAEVLDALATELGVVDEWVEAEAVRREALDLWRQLGDPVREGDSLRMLARALGRLARGQESEVAGRDALALLEPLGPSPELARALADAAGELMVMGDNAGSIATADRAIALAEQYDLADVLSNALDSKACALMSLGEDWVPTMRRARDVGLAGRCDQEVGRAYANWYSGLVGTRRTIEAEGLFLEAQKFCEDHEVASFGNCLIGGRLEALEFLGRWTEALELGRTYLEANTVSPNNWMHFTLGLGRVRLRRGDPDVDPDIDRAVELAEGTGEPQWVVMFRLLEAERHWVAGRGEEAAAAVASAVDWSSRVAEDGDFVGMAHLWARRLGVPAPAPRVVGELWEPELAGDVARAVAQWDAVGAPYEAALALAFSPSTADRVESVRRLDALGATAVAARVRKSLREDGVRSLPGVARKSTQGHPAGLTTREQEVLELLGRGLTNDEIAAALVISTKTAGHHVSAVLAKLGVANRRDAVTHAVRAGILPATSPVPPEPVERLAR